MKVVAINSAKGGVGKTFVTTGLAKALTKAGHKVAVLDLDVTTPNMGEIDGVQVLSASSTTEKTKNQIKKFIKRSLRAAKGVDYFLIETPPTIGTTYIALTESISNIQFVFVTTPHPNAIKDTKAGIKFFASRDTVPVGVVQNMTGEVLGEPIDSMKELGVETIGSIPFARDTDHFFDNIVAHIESLDFSSSEQHIKQTQNRSKEILSSVTVKDIGLGDMPLKFYNLETWDYVSERLVEKEQEFALMMSGGDYGENIDRMFNAGAMFDISTDKLAKILDEGESTTIMVNRFLQMDKAPIPYEINEATIIFDHPQTKGLPAFLLPTGVVLFHYEAMLADDQIIDDAMNNGGIDMGGGRIVPSLYEVLYYNRVFEKKPLSIEAHILDRYIRETGIPVSKEDVAFMIALLEKDVENTEEAVQSFCIEKYRESLSPYPDFLEHFDNAMEKVATANLSVSKMQSLDGTLKDAILAQKEVIA